MITNSVRVSGKDVKVYEYNKDDGIIGMMDCGGSNLAKINKQLPGIVRMVVTSRINHPEVRARQRAEEFHVPLVELDFEEYERERGVERGDYFRAISKQIPPRRKTCGQVIQIRAGACKKLQEMMYQAMEGHGIHKDIPVFAAGFMSLLSEEFVKSFFILNVHPGDLTQHAVSVYKKEEGGLVIERGKRTIVGDGWIPPAKAIAAGHDNLYSSMHVLTLEHDGGPILTRGYPLSIDYNYLESRLDLGNMKVLRAVGEAAQDTLKHIGDHVIAGAAFLDLFDGKWGLHEKSGTLAYNFGGNWYLAPDGIRIEEHIANNPDTPFKRNKKFLDEKINEFYKKVEKISKEAV